ncbi:lysylphosphatidylglycerol synthase domain-containing protein [Cellulomonas sp. ICMP 17802]|uniref:lysylphosphatidylglycerol synthase domain-containing protein n=1 Tax=Cellulomonas sp. ICMP 17802 TaxID=3239199 RepID=UPI00351AC2AD
MRAPSTPDAAVGAPPTYVDVRHRRSVADARAAFVWLVVLVAGVLLATVAAETMQGFAQDLHRGIGRVPRAVFDVFLVLVQVTYILLLTVTPLVLAATRRFALLGRGALALALGPLLFRVVELIPQVPTTSLQLGDALELTRVSWPPTGVLAGCTALAVVTSPALRRPWRRAVWVLLWALVALRVITSASAPLDVVVAIGVGGVVGSAVMLAFGRTVGELTPAGARRTLAEAGLDLEADPEPVDGGWTFRGRAGTGPVAVRVVGEHDWSAARLDQAYRRLRWRNVGDDEVEPEPARAVTTEAMTALLAATHGVRVPAVRAVARAPRGESLLAVDEVPGRPLSTVGPDELTDAVLQSAWAQVGLLRSVRIAHRELDLTRLSLDGQGRVWFTDLDHAQPAASDEVLAWDVAALLAATAPLVGPQRAVAAADAALGHDALTVALPRLAPASLSGPTRAAVKAAGGIAPLVEEVRRVTGAGEPDFEKVARFKPRTLVISAFLAVAVYFLAPQLADLPRSVQAIGGADPRWVIAVVLASAATYLGAALGLAGGTPGRVPVGEATSVALASSFVATFSPPGLGQVGLNIRYLQKRGFPTPVAVSASAAKESAVLVVHLLILATFAILAGSTGALSAEVDKLPPAGVVVAIVAGALVLAGVALAVPRLRALLRDRVVPAVRSSVDAMRVVVSSPVKLVTLLAGVALLPLGFATALYFSVRAVGVHDASFVAVALVSLTAGAIATAAPTPGGVGIVEAVLLASLTGIGVPSGPALAAVLLYRLGTFWLPIVPGLVSFRVLSRRAVI